MKCSECLEELATGSLRELSPESPVSRHAASCPDCGPLLTQLREQEYQAATVLNNLPPLSNPITVAETAGRLAQRRRMGGVVVTISSIALAIAIWFAADTLIPDLTRSGFHPATITETFPLTCLSPKQAGDMVNPYVRSPGTMYYTPKGVAAITVRATPAEMERVREVLRDFDNGRNASCVTRPPAVERPAQPERPEVIERPEAVEPVLAGTKTTPKTK
jgi:hypothetical protein